MEKSLINDQRFFYKKCYDINFYCNYNVIYLSTNFLKIQDGNERYIDPLFNIAFNSREFKYDDVINFNGNFFMIGRYWPSNIYHTIYQSLGSLLLAYKYGLDLNKFHVVGPSFNTTPYLKPLIMLFKNIKYIEIEPKKILFFNKILYSNQLYVNWDPNYILDNVVLESFIKFSDIIPNNNKIKYERIYISRNKDAKNGRKIINEEKFFKAISTYGFKLVNLSEYTIYDQILLFKNAKYIISPHGAGLVHTLFCKEGTRIIELFSETYIPYCFASIAISKKCKYIGVINEHIGEGQKADIIVNTKFVIKIIKNDFFYDGTNFINPNKDFIIKKSLEKALYSNNNIFNKSNYYNITKQKVKSFFSHKFPENGIITHHMTILYVNKSNKLFHSIKSSKKTENENIVSVALCNNKIVLITKFGYISSILSDGTITFSNIPYYFDAIIYNKFSFSLILNNNYLSAQQNGNFEIKNINLQWEKFYTINEIHEFSVER